MRPFVFLLLCCSAFAKAQSLNSYKYVLVANQYEFQSDPNDYHLNDLIVFELKKYGFEAFKTSAVKPADFNKEVCNVLTLDVVKTGFLKTKLDFVFYDCNENEVQRLQGMSRKKEFKRAYYEAVREGLAGLEKLDYKYLPDLASNRAPRKMQKTEKKKKPAVTDEAISEKQIRSDVKISKAAYQSVDKLYKAYPTTLGFELFNNEEMIARLRKGQSGSYLVSGDFNGLANLKDNNLIIELFTESGNQIIILERK
jgi:hypothetical protein